MTDAAVEFPTSFGFTEKDVADDATQEILPVEKHYRFRVTNCRKSISKKGKNPGSYMFGATCRALADPNKPKGDLVGPPVYDNIIVPKLNLNVPGHKKPKTIGLVVAMLRACFPDEVPEMPRRDPKSGKMLFKGKVIPDTQEQPKREEVSAIVHEVLEQMNADTSVIVDAVFYGFYTKQENKDDPSNPYYNIVRKSYELKADRKTGKMPKIMTAKDIEGAEKPARKDNGGKGTARPAKKKKGKKRS